MEFNREHTLLHRLIVVDGIGKCGKSLLLDIISCFHAVEKQEFNSFIEYISLAYKYKKISPDIAIAILKTEMDTELYNNMIGRYINTRLTDDTSLYRYHSPEKYLKRSLENGNGSVIHERVLAEKPIYLCWSHDLINKSDLIFEAFKDKLDFFYINRNPIDIIYEWDQMKYSDRMSKDPTEMQYNIKYKNVTVPEIACGWEEEFLSISPSERTVKMIHTYFALNRAALMKKKNYNNLQVFNFEKLISCPEQEIERLKNIIGNKPLPMIEQILIKARCPRIINDKDLLEKENNIKKNISSPYVDLLYELNSIYIEIKQLSKLLEKV